MFQPTRTVSTNCSWKITWTLQIWHSLKSWQSVASRKLSSTAAATCTSAPCKRATSFSRHQTQIYFQAPALASALAPALVNRKTPFRSIVLNFVPELVIYRTEARIVGENYYKGLPYEKARQGARAYAERSTDKAKNETSKLGAQRNPPDIEVRPIKNVMSMTIRKKGVVQK
jgi:hypothetical protein